MKRPEQHEGEDQGWSESKRDSVLDAGGAPQGRRSAEGDLNQSLRARRVPLHSLWFPFPARTHADQDLRGSIPVLGFLASCNRSPRHSAPREPYAQVAPTSANLLPLPCTGQIIPIECLRSRRRGPYLKTVTQPSDFDPKKSFHWGIVTQISDRLGQL